MTRVQFHRRVGDCTSYFWSRFGNSTQNGIQIPEPLCPCFSGEKRHFEIHTTHDLEIITFLHRFGKMESNHCLSIENCFLTMGAIQMKHRIFQVLRQPKGNKTETLHCYAVLLLLFSEWKLFYVSLSLFIWLVSFVCRTKSFFPFYEVHILHYDFSLIYYDAVQYEQWTVNTEE